MHTFDIVSHKRKSNSEVLVMHIGQAPASWIMGCTTSNQEAN